MRNNRLEPDTAIPGVEGQTVGDFWSWAFSNILTNNLRGIFAEFLVGAALDAVEGIRTVWDPYDLVYRDAKIEVKSSAYLQSWKQDKDSVISWSIGEHLAWDSVTNEVSVEKARSADCYVFCVYTERARGQANVLDVSKWEFYVLPTTVINRELGTQKTVVLSRISALTDPVPYSRLRGRVDEALASG